MVQDPITAEKIIRAQLEINPNITVADLRKFGVLGGMARVTTMMRRIREETGIERSYPPRLSGFSMDRGQTANGPESEPGKLELAAGIGWFRVIEEIGKAAGSNASEASVEVISTILGLINTIKTGQPLLNDDGEPLSDEGRAHLLMEASDLYLKLEQRRVKTEMFQKDWRNAIMSAFIRTIGTLPDKPTQQRLYERFKVELSTRTDGR